VAPAGGVTAAQPCSARVGEASSSAKGSQTWPIVVIVIMASSWQRHGIIVASSWHHRGIVAIIIMTSSF
jgi:hypothetical protein